jgi:hypothetical protein|tara:strand:+ start:1224 stop:1841 length:618 start_codon:yes stop_codon:yes gene_type:complete
MRFLIISLILFLSSCSLSIIKGLTKVVSDETHFNNLYFSNFNTDYIYKAKIKAFDNFYGGILIIKKIKDNNHRILFTSAIGSKIFDFEVIDDVFKILYIINSLNREIIIKTLKNDFKNLIKENNYLYMKYEDQIMYVYQSKFDKNSNYYVVNKETGILLEIIHTKKTRIKTNISFNEIKNNIAKNIHIQHHNLPLSIDLLYLNNK